jgi:23S rRNA pseudouridine2605 synthase
MELGLDPAYSLHHWTTRHPRRYDDILNRENAIRRGQRQDRLPMDQRRPPYKGGYAGKAPRGPRPIDRPRGRRTGHPTPKPSDDGEDRLQKVLAHAGIGSRRGCEELILKGRVTIDGKVIRELGTKIDPEKATVAVDGQKIQIERPVYYAVYKPKGYVSTNNDPSGRPRVLDILPEIPQRVYTVGRLDEMSVGLIILTNDGTLAHKLAHPKYGVEKLYRVVVAGSPPREVLNQLTEGIWLAEGKVRAKKVRAVGKRGESTILEMVLSEGKNREVRRMLAKLGHKVMSLTRIAVGPVTIKGLSAGQYRPLTSREVGLLRKVADGEYVAPFGADRMKTMKPDRPRPTPSTPAPIGPGSRRPPTGGPVGPGARRPAPGRPSGPAFRPEGPSGRRADAPGPVTSGPQRRPTGRPTDPGAPANRPPRPAARRPDQERLVPPAGDDLNRPGRGRRVIGLDPEPSPAPAERPRPRPTGKRPPLKPKPPRRAPGPLKSRRPGRQNKGK